MMAIYRSAFALGIGTGLLLSSIAHGADTEVAYAGLPHIPTVSWRDGIRSLRDVVYGTNEGVVLKMDMRVPDSALSNAAPAVIRIHGGSWMVGDKSGPGCVPAVLELLNRGYVVA